MRLRTLFSLYPMRLTLLCVFSLSTACDMLYLENTASDAATPVSTDSGLPTLVGTVTVPSYATDLPASSSVAGSGVLVQYLHGGNTASTYTASSGQFTLSAFDVANPVTWFALTSSTACSNVALPLATTGAQSAALPLFNSTFASSLAYMVSGYENISTSNKATVIIQLVNASSLQPVSGIIASKFGGQIPFYDAGVQNSYRTTLGTGKYGTIAYLGVDANTYNGTSLQLQLGDAGTVSTPGLMLTANCVTYLLLYVA